MSNADDTDYGIRVHSDVMEKDGIQKAGADS